MTVQILIGDVLDRLAELVDDSVDCVVTSPPYWGLRDYGVEGQLGMETTLGEHLEVMVKVFREVRRVLKPSGTLWLNYGDCYATSPNGRSAADYKAMGEDDRAFRDKPFSTIGPVHAPGGSDPFRRDQGRRGGGRNSDPMLKPKDLCMIPNRIALALWEDGWWVRSEIVWAKPNPMPESVRDRPASAHEKIWLLTKSPKYHFDADSVRQLASGDENANGFRGGSYVGGEPGPRSERGNYRRPNAPDKIASPHGQGFSREAERQRGHKRSHAGFNDRWDQMSRSEQQANGRSLRSYEPAPLNVWKMATRPFKEAHFATFPPELAERCIRAGCPENGIVLDPFGGAGTTGLVADRLRRDAILIELNPEYAEIAEDRLREDQQMFADVRVSTGQEEKA